ncbi:DUF6843 domain-containing protein [Halalkalibacter urbisdiaboli]|uniref:DUF6843 domain-containing protein n=1 Tax=Halalkalibacter urbisdiaboli TaxID=1960589 RepID=UPI000B43809D|nr:hypothetical protein [Halalkalibacter urbisdiaboli]
MRLLKVMLLSVILSIVYISLSERGPDTYYFSFEESVFWGLYYFTPIFLALGTISFIIYMLLEKIKRFSNGTRIGLSILAAGAITIPAIYTFISVTSTETYDIYLIPQGYEGDVFAFYNIPGAPRVETEEGYTVHKINDEGYFITSTPDLDYGTVTDKYYYVDKEGNRTLISNTCVSGFGTGGFETFDEGNKKINFSYTGFKLTQNYCSEEFMKEMHSKDSGNYEKIIRKILKEYYGIESPF